ncbi:MAG TPA: class I SAM-dependent methyltransferase, partial [Myxococcaceae bacterium]|nr:class I SAM-dependent methyltransferase [Myxococcaceae bacterium]
MMFGTGTAYDYFLCASCGCLQLVGFMPGEEQYPPAYYSYNSASRATGVRALLKAWRNRLVFRGKRAGWVVNRLIPYTEGAERWISSAGAGFSTRILDVGCGAGHLLSDLVDAGFKQARGIDPFIPDSVAAQLGGLVRKATLNEISGEYDIVMFHHVLEHLVDPQATLIDAARLLRPGGVCLVRIPVIPNEAWDRYRENWVQLDAPRHIFVHSTASLTLLAERAGFKLD